MDAVVKKEIEEPVEILVNENLPLENVKPIPVIDLSSSDSDFDSDSDDSTGSDEDLTFKTSGKRTMDSNGVGGSHKKKKKKKLNDFGIVLPVGFLEPLHPEEVVPVPKPVQQCQLSLVSRSCKQFWKAGDYEGGLIPDSSSTSSGGMDHVRVHPKFLHSNATSHKWALGAFAELLDNSLDEICNGATFANVDVLKNKKDNSKMLLVEDNGGGMDPDKMRHCMSLGYSMKSKLTNTIGQYGNGFKTSTMRLGADVIVFSRCHGKYGKSPTQSIGMLSYTFLRDTGKEDIVVPMLDYEKVGQDWNKMLRSSPTDWNRNVETIVQWSPYLSEADLLDQFNLMKDQGTRVIIYNLWEDDEGEMELDFDTDKHDIQIRGVNRDQKKIEMASQYPNSRHFLTYRHSLRSYASILYLRLPPGFRIGLRGKDVEHHNIVNDMMQVQNITYRPQPGPDGVSKDSNMVADVKIGFVKDAKYHIDIQGFNVYHKNRLIKPFWRVWNAAGSDGRGVIGVLEANFVEPAHDKQGFERTIVLSRLEARLVHMQKTFWSSNCQEIGYARRHKKKLSNGSAARENSPDYPYPPSQCLKKSIFPSNDTNSPKMRPSQCLKKSISPSKDTNSPKMRDPKHTSSGHMHHKMQNGKKISPTSPVAEDPSDSEIQSVPPQCSSPIRDNIDIEPGHGSNGIFDRASTRSQSKTADDVPCPRNGHASNSCLNPLEIVNQELKYRLKNMEESFLLDLQFEKERCRLLEDQVIKYSHKSDAHSQYQLEMENCELKGRLIKMEELFINDLQFERDRRNLLEAQLKESEQEIEKINREQEAFIEIFSEERNRRDEEEGNLRKKLKDATSTIQELREKVAVLEKMRHTALTCKQEHII